MKKYGVNGAGSTPLSLEQLLEVARRLNIPEAGLSYISQVYCHGPSREPARNKVSVRGYYPSRKMGLLVGYESHLAERTLLVTLEFDPDVLAFWTQPGPIARKWQGGGARWTPDFLVVKKDKISLIEVKLAEKLEKLAAEKPHIYQVTPEGSYYSDSSSGAASQFGFGFQFWSPQPQNVLLVENLCFLDNFTENHKPLTPEEHSYIKAVGAKTGISIQEATEGAESCAVIWRAISHGLLFAALEREKVSNLSTKLFSTEAQANAYQVLLQSRPKVSPVNLRDALKVGATLAYHGAPYTVLFLSHTKVTLADSNNNRLEHSISDLEDDVRRGYLKLNSAPDAIAETTHLLSYCSDADLRVAYERLTQIEKGPPSNPSDRRTYFRHKSAYKKAQQEHGNGFYGLLPKSSLSGAKTMLLPEVEEQVRHAYDHVFCSKAAPNYSFVYRHVLGELDRRNLPRPSYPTVISRFRTYESAEKVERARRGRRAATQIQSPVGGSLPKKSDQHALESMHLDSTLLDIQLKSDDLLHNYGRPRITLIYDAYSRVVLCFYLSFLPPSAANTLTALRLLVYRCGRVANRLVVDCGSEFDNELLTNFCALYQIEKVIRPAESPKTGSKLERFFDTLNSNLLRNMEGNTQFMGYVRMVSKSHDPLTNAVWPCSQFVEILEEYLYTVYPDTFHSGVNNYPSDLFNASMARSQGKLGKAIDAGSPDLQFSTSSYPKSGTTRRVQKDGVYVDGHYYWHEDFRNPRVAGTEVPVRVDHFSPNTVLVYAQGSWLTAVNSHPIQVSRNRPEDLLLEKQISLQLDHLGNQATQPNEKQIEFSQKIVRLNADLKASKERLEITSQNLKASPKPAKPTMTLSEKLKLLKNKEK